jgi:hypothetical protein
MTVEASVVAFGLAPSDATMAFSLALTASRRAVLLMMDEVLANRVAGCRVFVREKKKKKKKKKKKMAPFSMSPRLIYTAAAWHSP